MTNTVIEAKGLNKKFGSHKAIDNLTFSVQKGEILGFLGPSGSGKTTTINILTGQLIPDEGNSSILGKQSKSLTDTDLAKIGLVTENSGYYEKLTLYQNLVFFGKFYNVDKKDIDDLLKQVGLYESRKTPACKLSTGMKQRMLLVRAIINQPEVLFLDEPTSGLDPSTSQTIHHLIMELKAKGTTIFLTTHDMHEATLLCDEIILLNHGKVIEKGTPHGIIQKYNGEKKVKITYRNKKNVILSFSNLTKLPNIDTIQTIHSCEPTLEDIFIKLTGGKLNA